MVDPIGPKGTVGGSPIWGDQKEITPGPALPADDVWVKNLATLFPNVPLGIIQTFAAKFRDNMYQALNNQISSDLKKARAAARKLRDAIEGND